ncbi:MAG: flagellar basal body-associated FliL family protein [Betaproteobacteria bacterium]
MSEEKTEPTEEKPKKPIVKIIIAVVGVVLLIVLSVGGTLMATGVFSKKTKASAEQALEEDAPAADGHGAPAAGAHGAPAAGGHDAPAAGAHGEPAKGAHGEPAKGAHGEPAKGGGPAKKAIPSDKDTRFEKSYMELDDKKALVANVAGSRKVMQVSLSLMTQYDDRVFKNVEKHRAALRSGALDVLRQVTEADLAKPDFRHELAVRLREKINSELERLENFGGIEEVFFTEFVFQ